MKQKQVKVKLKLKVKLEIKNMDKFSEDTYVDLWNVNKIYEKIQDNGDDRIVYDMCDGPPFVSGKLHMGHLSISVIKSALFNYHSMTGKKVLTKLGYDCHGLPIESLVIKEKGYSFDSLPDIEQFNRECSETIDRYSGSWTPNFQKIGRLADFDNVYMTRDKNYMETCIWVFQQLYQKGLVYIGNKVMAYSYELNTPLSNFEASQNYKDIETNSIYVGFKFYDNTYFVAWTTTPWTLPMNMALCVNPDITYCRIAIDGDDNKYIIGKSMIKNFISKKTKFTIEEEYLGKDLENLEYESIFGESKNKIFMDPYVKEEGVGTSIVHMAPAFGEDDYRVCEKYGIVSNETIDEYCPVDLQGKFTLDDINLNGKLVFECNDIIRQYLKDKKVLFGNRLYKHSYPHCYRTDSPLIYRTVKSIFIRVSELKDRMIELNKKITWHPKKIGTNFSLWLENGKDWAVSRFRSYGTPIPIWVNDSDPSDMICIGSIDELKEYGSIDGEDISDISNLHPEHINKIKIIDEDKTYTRVPDIFDCWFESGCSPMAQIHYPFNPESKVIEDRDFLTDFICEGMDQTRGWFYTLLVISTAIMDKPAYENVMCMGLVLDKDGKKFSKKLGNYEDPMKLIEKYDADTIRTYILSSHLGNADPLKFNEQYIRDTKKVFIPYYNAVEFFMSYTKFFEEIKGGKFKYIEMESLTNIIDIWFVNRVRKLIIDVRKYMDTYMVNHAVKILLSFVDDLTNWYIKFNRTRLKGNDGLDEMNISLNVLYYGLTNYTKLLAPFAPFYSEYAYSLLMNYNDDKKEESVLLDKYPESEDYDEDILKVFADYKEISVASRILRSSTMTHKSIKTPLNKIIICADKDYLEKLSKNINCIYDELNCYTFEFEAMEDSVQYTIVIDHKKIGKKFRDESKNIKKYILKLDQDELKKVDEYGYIEYHDKDGKKEIIKNDMYQIKLVPVLEESDIIKSMICQSGVMVKIDHTYNEEINKKEQMRTLQSAIQQKRNDMGLKSWNKIILLVDIGLESYANIKDYIKLENADIITKVDFGEVDDKYDNEEIINDDEKVETLFNHTIRGMDKNYEIKLYICHRKK